MTLLGARPPKIARKDTTIFSNRCYNIEKLTLSQRKKSFKQKKKGQKDGKKIGFYHFLVTKCRFFCQNSGKFPNYNLLL